MNIRVRYKLVIAAVLIIAGVLLGWAPYRDSRLNTPAVPFGTLVKQPASVQNITPASTDQMYGKPVRIEIPSVGINVAIIDGYYNAGNGTWTLAGDKAQFALFSHQANTVSGNTYIYGHNNAKVFAKLPRTASGAQAKIYTDNGHVFTYIFRGSSNVDPSDSSFLNYTGAPQLIVQTCTGIWSQNRTLFTFSFEAAQ